MKIFFDLDGPILDVSKRYYAVYRDFCVSHGAKPLGQKSFWSSKRNKNDLNIPDHLTSGYKLFWWNNIESAKYLALDKTQKEALKILRDFSKKGITLCLVSLRHDKKTFYAEIRNFGLDRFFKKIFVFSPVPFKTEKNWLVKNKLLKKFVQKDDIIIGDTGTDILCGKKLRIKTVAVLNGITSYKRIKIYSPDYIVRGVGTLAKLKLL